MRYAGGLWALLMLGPAEMLGQRLLPPRVEADTIVVDGGATADDAVLRAGNFSWKTTEGTNMWLSQLPTDRLTLLVFYDPDCRDCRQMLFALRHSSAVKQRVGERLLQVVAVDAGGNEALWETTRDELPDTWMRGLLTSDLTHCRPYDGAEVPALFLLDADRRVMMAGQDIQTLTSLLTTLW